MVLAGWAVWDMDKDFVWNLLGKTDTEFSNALGRQPRRRKSDDLCLNNIKSKAQVGSFGNPEQEFIFHFGNLWNFSLTTSQIRSPDRIEDAIHNLHRTHRPCCNNISNQCLFRLPRRRNRRMLSRNRPTNRRWYTTLSVPLKPHRSPLTNHRHGSNTWKTTSRYYLSSSMGMLKRHG